MSKYPNLTESDSVIMELLWREGELSSAAIVRGAGAQLGWTRQTVRTYLARLMEKGLLAAKEANKRDYIYYPIVTREQYAADRSGSILNRYYGSLSDMVAGIVQQENISDEELDELDALVQRLRREKERDT